MFSRLNLLCLWFGLSAGLLGQQRSALVDWLAAVQTIERRLDSDATADVRGELQSLHREIAAWNAGRPDARVDLPEPPSELTNLSALQGHIAALRRGVEAAERARPGSAFYAGRVELNVTATPLQFPTAVTLDEAEYRLRNLPKVADALNLLPGVTIQKIGPRNERGVYVRGFDFRQVPLYMDGIPVYVPYDGYVDLDRFLTYDVSEIQVAKGFTSPLYGPNAVGGAINMISKAPNSRLNMDLGTGSASGDQVHGFLNAGTRFRRFWAQASVAWLSSDSFPLSHRFQTTPLQPDLNRRNAQQSDSRGRIRVAWTPNEHEQYTFTYARQAGEKGNPPYAGMDPAVRPRYWQWPQWDKESLYFIANKALGEPGYLRARFYYDKFNNLLYAFDNANYNSRNLPSSFISPYDDDTYGTIVDSGGRVGAHAWQASLYFKDDTHREGNVGEPPRTFRDQTYSIGLQDTLKLGRRTSAVLGFSADHLRVLNAQNFISGAVLPFPGAAVWAYNPQVGVFHALTESGKVRFTYARKTRLPTIKDRYSYRLGQAIPNPDLREERSDNLEIGYTQLLGLRTFLEAAGFQSQVSNSTQRFFVQPNVFQLRNLGEARYLGGELGIRTSIGDALQVWTNYTYLSRRNQTAPAIIVLDTPRHKVYSMARYSLHKRVTAFADFTYEGGRWAANDAGRVLQAGSFGAAGVGGSASLYRAVELQSGVNNLFDRNYVYVPGYPEAGRNWYVNLRYRF
ncbi:MAG TPA: TonB-dependent receptor [Bryobacteraceae bacterium]|nr:TonB-dependent receptor [Bryobacteraceae bacterium]